MTHLFDPRTIIPVLIIVVLGFGYGAIRQCSHVEYDASQIPPEMAGWIDQNWSSVEMILDGESWYHNYPKMMDGSALMIYVNDCTDERLVEIREKIKSIPSDFAVLVVANPAGTKTESNSDEVNQ